MGSAATGGPLSLLKTKNKVGRQASAIRIVSQTGIATVESSQDSAVDAAPFIAPQTVGEKDASHRRKITDSEAMIEFLMDLMLERSNMVSADA